MTEKSHYEITEDARRHSGDLEFGKYAELREFIRKRIEFWVGALGLKWYETEIRYYNHRADKNDNESTTLATTWSQWCYRKIIISFYLPAIDEAFGLDEEKVDRLIIHEVMHGFISPMRPTPGANLTQRESELMIQMEEMAVSNLTTAFWFMFREAKRIGSESKPVE